MIRCSSVLLEPSCVTARFMFQNLMEVSVVGEKWKISCHSRPTSTAVSHICCYLSVIFLNGLWLFKAVKIYFGNVTSIRCGPACVRKFRTGRMQTQRSPNIKGEKRLWIKNKTPPWWVISGLYGRRCESQKGTLPENTSPDCGLRLSPTWTPRRCKGSVYDFLTCQSGLRAALNKRHTSIQGFSCGLFWIKAAGTTQLLVENVCNVGPVSFSSSWSLWTDV